MDDEARTASLYRELGDSELHICGYAYGVYFTNLLIPMAVFHILRID